MIATRRLVGLAFALVAVIGLVGGGYAHGFDQGRETADTHRHVHEHVHVNETNDEPSADENTTSDEPAYSEAVYETVERLDSSDGGMRENISTLSNAVRFLHDRGLLGIAATDAPGHVTVEEPGESDLWVGEAGGVMTTLQFDGVPSDGNVGTGRVGTQTSAYPVVQADDGERELWYVYYGNTTTGRVYVTHVVEVDGASDSVRVVNIPDVQVHPDSRNSAGDSE